jgi:hypothetical protein
VAASPSSPDPSDAGEPDAGGAAQGLTPALRSEIVRIDDHGNALVRLRCPENAVGGCRGTITLRLARRKGKARASLSAGAGKRRKARGRVIGRGKFSLDSGESARIEVKLSRNGRRRVLRNRKVRCSVNIKAVAEDGTQTVTKGVLTLKAPKEPAS